MPNKRRSPAAATSRQIDTEREQRVAGRDRVEYSYTVFWLKHARLWDAVKRETAAQRLTELLSSADFDANFYQRMYTLTEVDGAHSGASLVALQKVLSALRET
jgi:hypothetical protein